MISHTLKSPCIYPVQQSTPADNLMVKHSTVNTVTPDNPLDNSLYITLSGTAAGAFLNMHYLLPNNARESKRHQ
ncbi:hypothetical protein ASPTUDRAFT_224615 [Aspergillus tubingensis CBS 134.48]|uniref:Uncharacterized protein n=1 Tax=Aspergillus tubingensis (strain CBS 134.48) TaxID=767770 RepID=A0A1L9NLX8_ASPTC|nr:hypothetical protein ASPTUDRAFT_224615 [Aspergillus tubingensis CBS 134.48]